MNKFDFIEVYINIYKEELEIAYKSNAENGIYDEFDIEFIKEKLEALKQIKQDLESYKNVMELIKELFKNIDTIDIFGKHVFICKVNGKSFQIDRPTQKVLQELKKAGDSQ